MRWTITTLAILSVYMAFVDRAIYASPDRKIFGIFFLAIGLVNVLTYRTTGRKFFAKTQHSRPFVAKLWARVEEKGVQFLFLGIGIVFSRRVPYDYFGEYFCPHDVTAAVDLLQR